MILDIIKKISKSMSVERNSAYKKNWFLRRSFYLDMQIYKFASQFVKNKIVLNIACGYGDGNTALNKGEAKQIVAVDKNRKVIEIASNSKCTSNITCFAADAEQLPFRKNSFDVAVSIETIEHVNAPEKFLLELQRVLKKNGKLIISTPNKKVESTFLSNPYHISLLATQEIKDLLNKTFKNFQQFRHIYFRRSPRILRELDFLYAWCFGKGDIIPAKKEHISFINVFVVSNKK